MLRPRPRNHGVRLTSRSRHVSRRNRGRLVVNLEDNGGVCRAADTTVPADSRPVRRRTSPASRPPTTAGRTYKLSSNESPFGPLPSVLKVIADAAGEVNRYPDNGAVELTEAIAARYGVPPEHIAVGCGSVGLVQQLLEAVSEPGAEVLYAWRSFEAYPVPDRPGRRDVGHGAARRRARTTSTRWPPRSPDATRLIFVCTPNNPTGTVVTHRRARPGSSTRCPPTAWSCSMRPTCSTCAILTCPTGSTCTRDRPNVAVLRTFSKAYGLAGLRVGFLVGQRGGRYRRAQDDADVLGQRASPRPPPSPR